VRECHKSINLKTPIFAERKKKDGNNSISIKTLNARYLPIGVFWFLSRVFGLITFFGQLADLGTG